MIGMVLALALLLVAAPSATAEPSRAEVHRRADALSAQLRCPVCQGLSVRDSPSEVAQTMRARVRDLVAAGRSDEEVRAFFVARYGEWILLSPPRRGIAIAVWVLPPVIVLSGLLLVVFSIRRWTRRAQLLAEEGRQRPDAVARIQARMSALERGASAGAEEAP